jgi:hypothetical protein
VLAAALAEEHAGTFALAMRAAADQYVSYAPCTTFPRTSSASLQQQLDQGGISMSWVKRLIVVSGLGLLLAIALMSQGIARPTGGCPTAKWILDEAPSGDTTGTPSVDGNGDGLSCYLEAPVGSGIFTIIDNRVVRP